MKKSIFESKTVILFFLLLSLFIPKNSYSAGVVTVLDGWPQDIGDITFYSNPIYADIDNNGDIEMVTYTCHYCNKMVQIFNHDGSVMQTFTKFLDAAPTLADLDGDGDLEIIMAGAGSIEAYQHTGELLWKSPLGQNGSWTYHSPAVDDMDGDGDLEIVLSSQGYGSNEILVFDDMGNIVAPFPYKQGSQSYYNVASALALGDLDGDGKKEIVFAGFGGTIYVLNMQAELVWTKGFWELTNVDSNWQSLSLGDLDKDGKLEVVAGFRGTGEGMLYVFNYDGSVRPGWPKVADRAISSAPALGDIDGDGDLEIVIGGNFGNINAYHDDGSIIFNYSLNQFVGSSLIGDINGDGFIEIVAPSSDGNIYAWTNRGELLPGWPISVGASIKKTSLGDINGDGLVEIMAITGSGIFHIWTISGIAQESANIEWPMFHFNYQQTGRYNSVFPGNPKISVIDSNAPVDDLNINFGEVTALNTSEETITITNSGNIFLSIGQIASIDLITAPFSILNDNCSNKRLSILASCTVTVAFSPASNGSFSDTFDIPSSAKGNNITFNLSGLGSGFTQPNIQITDSAPPTDDLEIPFGSLDISSSLKHTITITNNGNKNLQIFNIANPDIITDPFTIEEDNCSAKVLLPAAKCTLIVIFSPVTPGDFTDTFNIDSNDPDEATLTIKLSGNASPVPVPDIMIKETKEPAYDRKIPFGNISLNNSETHSITIKNIGKATLTIRKISKENPLNDPFTLIETTNCNNFDLLPNEECSFFVKFSPTKASNYNDSFDIPSNDPDEAVITVDLSGTGLSNGDDDSDDDKKNNYPSKVELKYPAYGEEDVDPNNITFIWVESVDPDGDDITYNLNICENEDFSNCSEIKVESLISAGKNKIFFAGFSLSWMLFAGLLFTNFNKRAGLKIFILLIFLIFPCISIVGCSGQGDSPFTAAASPPSGNIAPTPGPNEASYTYKGELTIKVTYYWKIVTTDSNNNSTESNTGTFTTK